MCALEILRYYTGIQIIIFFKNKRCFRNEIMANFFKEAKKIYYKVCSAWFSEKNRKRNFWWQFHICLALELCSLLFKFNCLQLDVNYNDCYHPLYISFDLIGSWQTKHIIWQHIQIGTRDWIECKKVEWLFENLIYFLFVNKFWLSIHIHYPLYIIIKRVTCSNS